MKIDGILLRLIPLAKALAFIVLSFSVLSGCGKKGSLYLPADPPAIVNPEVVKPTDTNSEATDSGDEPNADNTTTDLKLDDENNNTVSDEPNKNKKPKQ